MTVRISNDFMNAGARTFDRVLRRHAPAAAQYLFDRARPNLSPGATLENVEFDTECNRPGGSHGRACRIKYVIIRRRGGASGDVVVGLPMLIGPTFMAQIIQAHNLVYTG